MNIIKQLRASRIGPDMITTHWLLHFNWGQKILKKKLKKCGENVFLRPGCILVDMDSIELGNKVSVRPETAIYANTKEGAKIIIEDNVLIAPGVFITVNNHRYDDTDTLIKDQGGDAQSITIKSGAWIGARAIILSKAQTIGKGSVVAAGSVVTKPVPDYCVVAGVPARVIRNLKEVNQNTKEE